MNTFFDLITRFAGESREWVLVAALVFLRVGATMALLPAFGEQAVPQRVRLVLALAFTAAILPSVAPGLAPLVASGGMPFGPEIAAGLIVGAGFRLLILALQTAGAIIAQATSLAQLFGSMGEPQPAVGNLLTMSALALAMAMDMHVHAARILILSYDILPAGLMPGAADAADWGVARVGEITALAFALSAPFLIASLIYNVALGVINRAMPQLMVSFIGTPALTLGGLALMALVLPVGLAVWTNALQAWMADPFGVAP